MADLEDFDIQAVQIAIEISESMNSNVEPLSWLRTNWKKNVAKIAAQAYKLGQNSSPNSVGEVSLEEAEAAYISCEGNMKEAAEKCVQDRQILVGLILVFDLIFLLPFTLILNFVERFA